MKPSPTLRLLCALALGAGAVTRAADAGGDLAARVIILANSADADSLALAHYYAEKRGVPAANIVALRLPLTEMISRQEFDTQLYQPLQDALVRGRWIDGLAVASPGPRHKYSMLGHRISYLVVCRGVPLSVGQDDTQPADSKATAPNPSLNAGLNTNAAAVDSELALLARSGWPLGSYVANPLFRSDRPPALLAQQIVKVGRLDGPTPADARRLVDGALAAEATGLIGRAYIDIGGPYGEADKWLETAAKELTALGFDTDVDRNNPATLGAEARFDAPALYFGWYSATLNGPFARAGFAFPPGAVALHIYSYSGSTMRDAGRAWAPGLVARGVAGTFGNVTEPFLSFTHWPQLVLHALARGDTLGDAAAYAVPSFSWMAILIGDPLYRPFKIPFDEQWENRAKLPAALRPYVVMRKMRLLEAGKKHAEAVATGQDELRGGFSLPVALTLADLQRAAGDKAGAARSLAPALAPDHTVALANAPQLAAVAAQFGALGEKKSALLLWQRLLALDGLERELRTAWLAPATAAARTAGDAAQTGRWDAELKALAPSQPEQK